MTDISFDTPEKKAQAVADFTGLLAHPGWALLEAIVRYNMELVQNQILEGLGEEETMDTVKQLRMKLSLHKEIIETPKSLIERLAPNENKVDNDDPYDSA
jgi:hypothetical protein